MSFEQSPVNGNNNKNNNNKSLQKEKVTDSKPEDTGILK